MNIDHVRTFLEIAATGSFNRAAERLNVTQSTVSARIKALEQRLDRTLFTRGHNNVDLTAAGQQFYRYAVNLVRTWEQARQEVALPKGFRTAFGLGVQTSLWERLIARWIPWMRQQAPDVALRLEADYSDSLMHQVAGGFLDIGIMYAPRTTPGLVIEKLMEEVLVLVSTQPRDIGADWLEDYVLVNWGRDFLNQHSNAFPEMGAPSIAVGLGAMGLQYILEHGGSGYFPLRVVRQLIAEQRVFQVNQAPQFKRPVYMVHPAHSPDPELLDLALRGLRRIAIQDNED